MYNFDSILTEDDLSLLSCEDHSDNVNLNKEMLCPECWRLPIIKIDSSKHIITSDCNFNHRCILDLNQFIKKSSNHSLYDISCSICQKNQNKSKIIYQYCLECNNFLCNLCSQNHDTQKQNKNHHLISIDKLNSYCILHKNKYNSYCETCSKLGININAQYCITCLDDYKYDYFNYFGIYPSNCVPEGHFYDQETGNIVKCTDENSRFYFK